MKGLETMRVLYNKEYDRMRLNGWKTIHPNKSNGFTSEESQQLEAKYKQVKYYYTTTTIKGYYHTMALVK